MGADYSEAARKTSETNPLQLSNLFHMVVGAVSLVCGVLMAFLLTRQMDDPGPALVSNLLVSALLIVVGLRKVGQSWKDEKFRFHPDDVGKIGTPEKFAAAGPSRVQNYLNEVLNNGVVPPAPPDHALLRKLYNMVPKLEFAPEVIRWHAETQALRIVHLLVATLGFVLVAVFAQAHVFAWLAPIYLLLLVRPTAMLRSMFKGTSAAEQVARPQPPKPGAFVAVLLGSIFVPIGLGMVPADVFPPFPLATSVVVVPTVIAIAGLLLASVLFILSLKAQTRDLTASGVGHVARDDLDITNLNSGLIDTLMDKLPFPRDVITHQSGWKNDKGSFGGALMLETDPRLNEVGSHLGKLQAVSTSLADPEQRPVVALGLLGAATGVLAPICLFGFMLKGAPILLLCALGLFSASEFALFASRGLWNRLDFTSTLYKVTYHGNYRSAQSVAGNVVTGPGTLTETRTVIENVVFHVCVARMESVSFNKKEARYLQSIDMKPEQVDWIYALIDDYYGAVNRRRLASYQDEGRVRQLVQGGVSAANPDNLPSVVPLSEPVPPTPA